MVMSTRRRKFVEEAGFKKKKATVLSWRRGSSEFLVFGREISRN
jgi:hypothetical protein